MQFEFALSFVKLFDPWLETCHTLMIKITYTSTHMLYFYHWKIVIISIHSQNKTPSSIMTLSPRLPSRIWAIQKEIKDAYPKKVCHMAKRHEKKECQEKRKDAYPKKVCHMSTRHVEKKRREEKKYSPCPRKKYTRREIDHTKEFIHYPPKIFHTLAPLDHIVWLVSFWILFLT